MRLLVDEENENENDRNVAANLGKIMLPISFVVIGFILTFVCPRLSRYRQNRRRRDNQANHENLTEEEIDDSIMIKVRCIGTI